MTNIKVGIIGDDDEASRHTFRPMRLYDTPLGPRDQSFIRVATHRSATRLRTI